jgi:hypothetical protein
VIGEDYDGFVTDSNLFLLTQDVGKLLVSFEVFCQVFLMRILWGFILNECTLMMIFVQVFSQWGFLGLYFIVQSKMES